MLRKRKEQGALRSRELKHTFKGIRIQDQDDSLTLSCAAPMPCVPRRDPIGRS